MILRGGEAGKSHLQACGIGPMRSTESGETIGEDRASTENIEKSDDRHGHQDRAWEMARRDCATRRKKSAAYSSPHSAPKVILLNTLKLKRLSEGSAKRSGWYSRSVPCRCRMNGRIAQHCDGDHGEQAADVGNPFTEAQAEMRDES